MADLGSVGKLYGGLNDYRLKRHPASWWRGFDGKLDSNGRVTTKTFIYNVSGSLSGIVTRQGTPVANVWVRLYYRPTGALIAQTKSASNGAFSFSPSNDIPVGLDATDTKNYYVLAIDNNNSQNTPTADLLTAV